MLCHRTILYTFAPAALVSAVDTPWKTAGLVITVASPYPSPCVCLSSGMRTPRNDHRALIERFPVLYDCGER
jgi:hypothetical protein